MTSGRPLVATPIARARSRRALQQTTKTPPRDYGFALAVSLVALAAAHLADRVLSVSNLSQLFIVAVLIVAVRSRMSVAVFSAIVCFLGYNFFFAPPRYTLAIANGGDALTVVLFLATALICSRLATRLSVQVQMLREANAQAGVLGRLGRELAAAADAGQVTTIGADSLGYLSIEGLLSGVGSSRGSYCTSCYTGQYPVAFPQSEAAYLQLALKLTK